MANDGDLIFLFVISLRCLGCLGQSSPRKAQDGSGFGEVFSLPLSLSRSFPSVDFLDANRVWYFSNSHMGVSLNAGTPISHPKSLSFLVGKPMVVGYHHFRKPTILGNLHKVFANSCNTAFGIWMLVFAAGIWWISERKRTIPTIPCALPVGWSSFRCDFYLALLVWHTDVFDTKILYKMAPGLPESLQPVPWKICCWSPMKREDAVQFHDLPFKWIHFLGRNISESNVLW